MPSTPGAPLLASTRRSAAIMLSRPGSSPSTAPPPPVGSASVLPWRLTHPCPALAASGRYPRSGAGHHSPAFCFSSRQRKISLLPALHVQPFIGRSRRLLRPRLTSAAPSRHLAASVAHPPKQGQNGRPPRVRRVTFAPSTCRIYAGTLRMTSGFRFLCPLARVPRLYAVRVPQAGALRTASFGPRLATTPLLFG